MAIIQEQGSPSPITGLTSKGWQEAVNAAGIPHVDNPVSPFNYAITGLRAGLLYDPRRAELIDVQNAYEVDSYVFQSVSKHTEKLLMSGPIFKGNNDAAVQYVKTRFDMMSVSTGRYWFLPFEVAIRDFVKFANGFLVKARFPKNENIFTMKKKGMRRTSTPKGTKPPVAGYFDLNPLYLIPNISEGKHIGWRYRFSTAKDIMFDLDDVIHLCYNKVSTSCYGFSYLVPVLEDVRALRQCEEMVIHLIYKNLNPLIQHEIPDRVGNGLGDQRDIDRVVNAHNIMAVNGYIATPPGHKINVIGVESRALRAEGYIKMIKYRVYAGLGLSDNIMGESSSGASGSTEAFASILMDRIRFFQLELSFLLTYLVVWEILQEGGFDPIFNEDDRVFWTFDEVDKAQKIRDEAHALLLYHGNAITESELRRIAQLPPLTKEDYKELYMNRIQIPLAAAKVEAQAKVADATSPGGGTPTGGAGTSPTPNKPDAPDDEDDAEEGLNRSFVYSLLSYLPEELSLVDEISPSNILEAINKIACESNHGTIPPKYQAKINSAVTRATEKGPTNINALIGWLSAYLSV